MWPTFTDYIFHAAQSQTAVMLGTHSYWPEQITYLQVIIYIRILEVKKIIKILARLSVCIFSFIF